MLVRRKSTRERLARESSRRAKRASGAALSAVKPLRGPASRAGGKVLGVVKGVATVGLVAGTVSLVMLVLDALLVRDIDRP